MLATMQVLRIYLFKGIQCTVGFRIPARGFWIPTRGFRVLRFGFGIPSIGFRIPRSPFYRIPDSWIPLHRQIHGNVSERFHFWFHEKTVANTVKVRVRFRRQNLEFS